MPGGRLGFPRLRVNLRLGQLVLKRCLRKGLVKWSVSFGGGPGWVSDSVANSLRLSDGLFPTCWQRVPSRWPGPLRFSGAVVIIPGLACLRTCLIVALSLVICLDWRTCVLLAFTFTMG